MVARYFILNHINTNLNRVRHNMAEIGIKENVFGEIFSSNRLLRDGI